ncbi:MAG: sugar ABC transporter ATP-binding protein [Atribacterota bacterium]
MNTVLVEMRGIVKKFPGVIALDHVNFDLRKGEVHVLLGENGAGKSTLIKVLSGAYPADEGEIFIEGELVHITSPHIALNRGLRFIYQEPSLVFDLDVARNIFLGIEPVQGGFLNLSLLYRMTEELLQKMQIDLNPRKIVRYLSVTEQKMVEIARALATQAKAIILDEPTDVLESYAREKLFTIIRNLKQKGVGFVYISHRYAEVYEIGDRVTILRDGKSVGTFEIKSISFETMIEKMVGRTLEKRHVALSPPQEKEALRLENVSRGEILRNITITVKKGEIVSVTGLMGAGKTELAETIFGIHPKTGGTIYIDGEQREIQSPDQAIRWNVAFLPEDRKTKGLILDQAVRDNYGLPNVNRLSRLGFIRFQSMNQETERFIKELRIKTPHRYTLAGQLSGGNQQKLVLAKWLGMNPKVLLLDEPTRGIDVLGRREIYRIVAELAAMGTAVLLFTSDYSEALELSHRILVMRRGEICQEFLRGEVTEDAILKAAIGEVKCIL